MELNISPFFKTAAPMDYSASQAEIGRDAGPSTWRAACDDSADNMLLDDDEKREAFRAFVQSSGGWTEEEIAAWSDIELNALCLQWIAGDMREPVGFELGPDTTAEQWADYEKQVSDGQISGRIFKGTDNEIYFYIGE